ncbi:MULTISPECIES: LysM peptidoglycan-binding domain-containing protein [Bradyrhizobium]|uniref:LysM peptidoglycan-binding domain-containing protein n=1 Tax=Bradyrhizobium TaxID=374 RepID=UPI001BAB7B8B|nr:MULTISPECIES: LysM peptidoglycan-binding domain-containing protein [Bradyrhizobium]MBR1367157.1 LysM peptidoglycan-binding domain-containing protein [Bradyrhizobium ottawaense]MDA9414311.1 peptidoglycan-binding protein LysM [Bradyrhizobium sp. CCBAU 25360]
MMTASKAFIALCLLALVGTVLVIGPTELRRLLPDGTKTAVAAKPESKVEPKVEAKVDLKPEPKLEQPKPDQPKLAAIAPPAPAALPSPAPEPKVAALGEIQKQVTALPDLAPVKPPLAVADTGPRFDVARVDDHGEAAVIAGQATPGAKVELLRDGKPLDTVVADASGQFVMTPPQLPAGSYELTLRARAPDGTVTQSSRTMPVTIAEAAPPPARPAPVARQDVKQAEKPDDKSDVVAALQSGSPHLAAASDRLAARPKLVGAPKPRVMARAPAATTVASASPADGLSAAPAETGSRVISRGDSLWALSRLAYGDGARYAVIFKANRDKIHNPNLIYPGQTFVMPQKAE